MVLIVAILAIAAALFFYTQNQRTRKLRGKYGPEYDHLLRERGDARRAEQELVRREKRVEKFHIRKLSADESRRYAEAWRVEQESFVDDPRGAIERADALVCNVMIAKGYPMADFDQRIADVSVDHPQVVEHYRFAHDIAVRDRQSSATTEDLRQAMTHYRSLFEDLLDIWQGGETRKAESIVTTEVRR